MHHHRRYVFRTPFYLLPWMLFFNMWIWAIANDHSNTIPRPRTQWAPPSCQRSCKLYQFQIIVLCLAALTKVLIQHCQGIEV